MSFDNARKSGAHGVGIWASELSHRIKIWARAVIVSGMLALFLLGYLVHKTVPVVWLEVTLKFQVAKLFRGSPIGPTFTIEGIRFTAHDMLRKRESYQMEAAVLHRLRTLLWFASPVFFLVLGGFWLVVRRKDASMARGEHIRGMTLVSEKKLAKMVKRGPGLLPFGSVILPRKYEAEHVMIAGKTRVGKTVALMQQLVAIRDAGLPAVVYDFKGEYVEKFYRPGVDHIANPLDERGIKWNIFDDIDNIPDISAVTGSLIPQGGGEEHFWCAAAQDVLRGVVSGLHPQGRCSNEDLWKALFSKIQNIAQICDSTEQGAAGLKYIEDTSGKQALIVGAVLMSYVSWLEFACNGSGFSIKKWIDEPKGSFIFITGRPEVENTLRPYISLLIDLLGKRLLSVSDDKKRRIYFVLDEFGNLQKLPSIKRLLTAGGSKGATVLLGFQDFAAIAKTYGREDAETILNSCGTSLVLKLSDETTARIFSGRFGETQDWEVTETHSTGEGKSRNGVSFTRAKRTDRLLLPSEIQSLPKLQGFLLIPEHEPAKIKLRINGANQLPAVNKAFILRPGLSLDDIKAKEVVVEKQKATALLSVTPSSPQNKECPVMDVPNPSPDKVPRDNGKEF